MKKLLTELLPDIRPFVKKIFYFPVYLKDYLHYSFRARKQDTLFPKLMDVYPLMMDKFQQSGSLPQHYFFQDLWAAKRVYQSKTTDHFDVGSSVEGFIAHIAVFCRVKVLDIRPQSIEIDNVQFIQDDILNSDLPENSVFSLSCLHAAEHIGLGRYGDPIDPLGADNAMKSLQKILAIGGNLYFSVPIGRERVCFNAHRVFNPRTIIENFDQLRLVSFSAINDQDEFISEANLDDFDTADYSCGLFHFTKY